MSNVRLSIEPEHERWVNGYLTRWRSCVRCPLSANTKTRPIMRGRIPFDLLLVGEAPGESEDTLGYPFVGPAGRLLDYIVTEATGCPRVVNLNREGYDVRIDRMTEFGNPFVIGKDGNREEVIRKFAEYAKRSRFIDNVLPTLLGQKLGCHCAPQPCHGDVLVEMMYQRKIIPSYLIVNCVICTPPRESGKIREPLREEKELCSPHIAELIDRFEPGLVLSLGQHADKSLKWVEHEHTVHPASLLRQPERKADIEARKCIFALQRMLRERKLAS